MDASEILQPCKQPLYLPTTLVPTEHTSVLCLWSLAKTRSLFGAISLDGKQLFRQYSWFDEDTFLDYLKQVHRRFPRCYLFLDKAVQHYKSEKVKRYFEEHKDTLIPVWLPTASPEFTVLETCWQMSKESLLAMTYYPSFGDFKRRIRNYFRTKRFNPDMRKYLTEGVSA